MLDGRTVIEKEYVYNFYPRHAKLVRYLPTFSVCPFVCMFDCLSVCH